MATVSEKRAWLKDNPHLLNGHNVPDRGRLSPDLEAIWAEHHDDDEPWGTEHVTDADFGPDPDELEPSVPVRAEIPPARPKAPPRQRLFGKREKTDPKTAGKGKRKLLRVPVDHLISRLWEGGARLASPVSIPLATCLTLQSPVAGMVLEDVVKNTAVDTFLQPIARAEEKIESAMALLMPPLCTVLLERTMMLPEPDRTIRQAMLMPIFDEGLRIWLKVAGPKVEEAAVREAEYQAKYGATINTLKAQIFAPYIQQPEPEPEMAGV
jgi:hypothetical protein